MVNKSIPIIDLFAGPGGLGEGFSSVFDENNERVFDIKLSIEKDPEAHKTLRLRSFFRQFDKNCVPDLYYQFIKEVNHVKKEQLFNEMKDKYSDKWAIAEKEAWLYELPFHKETKVLNGEKFCIGYTEDEIETKHKEIDKRISDSLNGCSEFVLIGGPPCQAYSLVGRSRNRGIFNKDHRVHLYKEYLRIIAKHQPTVFVMENVKGLLSAKVNDRKVFDLIIKDLENPNMVYPGIDSKKYKIFSLVTEPENIDGDKVTYSDNRDYLIKSELYNIPQKRHRVILLGIRADLDAIPDILKKSKSSIKLKEIIGDMPEIRSGVSRTFVRSEIINGKKKRYYKKEEDTSENWQHLVNSFLKEMKSKQFSVRSSIKKGLSAPDNGIGAEYIECNSPSKENPLYKWYYDSRLKGICNHESRSHLSQDLKRYLFASLFADKNKRFPRLQEYEEFSKELLPDHENAKSGKFADRFRVQIANEPATTVTSHISKDGHYFIHYDPRQCRSLTVREAARIQTFPDNYYFCGSRTAQFHQVGNAVPPYLARQIGEIVFNVIVKNCL